MKLATLTASVIAVLVCGSVMGCSSGRTMPPDVGPRPIDTGVTIRIDAPFTPIDTGGVTTPDSPSSIPDSPRRDTGGGGRVCIMGCTSDAQCASSCPANPLGANCCDMASGVCYGAMTAVCPVAMPDDGGGTMY